MSKKFSILIIFAAALFLLLTAEHKQPAAYAQSTRFIITGDCPAGSTAPVLTWNALPEAVSYNVRVDNHRGTASFSRRDCGPHAVCVNNWTATSLTFQGSSDGLYHAWVEAVNAGGHRTRSDNTAIFACGSAASRPASCFPQPSPRVINGLISAVSLAENNKFSNTLGQCVINDQVSFAPYKIETVADFMSLYYTQSKATKSTSSASDLEAVIGNNVYYYSNPTGITVSGLTYSFSGAAVVFVGKDLRISGNIVGETNNGLVFVAGGDVYIHKDVRRIDAVILSSDNIYTAADLSGGTFQPCATSSVNVRQASNALTINGSLISLGPGSIFFCRSLDDNNSNPAEIINIQPKYLVLLKDLFADTKQKWSEIQ